MRTEFLKQIRINKEVKETCHCNHYLFLKTEVTSLEITKLALFILSDNHYEIKNKERVDILLCDQPIIEIPFKQLKQDDYILKLIDAHNTGFFNFCHLRSYAVRFNPAIKFKDDGKYVTLYLPLATKFKGDFIITLEGFISYD